MGKVEQNKIRKKKVATKEKIPINVIVRNIFTRMTEERCKRTMMKTIMNKHGREKGERKNRQVLWKCRIETG